MLGEGKCSCHPYNKVSGIARLGGPLLVVASSCLEGNTWGGCLQVVDAARKDAEQQVCSKQETNCGLTGVCSIGTKHCVVGEDGGDACLYTCEGEDGAGKGVHLRGSAMLSDHDDVVSCVAALNSRIATGSWDSTVKLWDVTNLDGISGIARPIMSYRHPQRVLAVDFVNEWIAATASACGWVMLWDERSPEHTCGATRVSSAPLCVTSSGASGGCGNLMATGCDDGTIVFFDTRSLGTGCVSSRSLNSCARIHCAEFSPCGRELAAGDDGGRLHILASLEETTDLPNAILSRHLHSDYLRALAWESSGEEIWTGGWDGFFRKSSTTSSSTDKCITK